MNTRYPEMPWLPPEFFENQKNIPPAMLQPYVNQYIAWNWQGDRILAAAASEEELMDLLKAGGTDTNRVVFDYVPDPNVSYL
jgi:hypothetical protein